MVLVSKSWILMIPIPFLRAVVDEENMRQEETANGQDGKVTKFQYSLAGHSGQVLSLSACGVRGSRFKSHHG